MGFLKLSGFIFLFFGLSAQAKISALFHPNEPTLETIAEKFSQAKANIDIAMYNMDVTPNSPIIQWLSLPTTQARIQNKQLFVRVLLNGSDKKGRTAKLATLEKLGVDGRELSSSRELHHKFAVIDGSAQSSIVISGSANWSESSRKNYNENIFFVEDEAPVTVAYQNQFNLLWKLSDEFGATGANQDVSQLFVQFSPGLEAYFNVPDETWMNRSSKKNLTVDDYLLTGQAVAAIDSARISVDIASTRLRLRPIYDALVRAISRGIRIRVVLTMAEYSPFYIRDKFNKDECADAYAKVCSTNTNYAIGIFNFIERRNPNVELRTKQYSLKSKDAITRQMHSKYMIIDGKRVLSGSFNWSFASEFSNIENVVSFQSPENTDAVAAYQKNFESLWQLNRDQYPQLLADIENKLQKAEPVPCAFADMSLTYPETDAIFALGQKYKVRLESKCK